MSDTLVVVGGGGSGQGGTSTPPPMPSLASLITPAALADLRELLLRQEARGTLIGISAIRTLLLAELVEHVKLICKDYKRVADYVAPATPDSVTAPPSGGATSSATPSPQAVRVPSQFVADLGDKMTEVVKIPVEQLRTTVESQGKTIDKDTAGIAELQFANTTSEARLRTLEANYLRLDASHRGLSERVAEMDFELGESEEATEALGEAVREAGSPVIVVVEEGERADTDEPVRKAQARPTRQAGANVRKAQARKKK